MKSVYDEAANLSSSEEDFVIAKVIHTQGSTPQKPGASLLVKKDGSTVGTLGGGCVEGDIWFAAKEALREKSGSLSPSSKIGFLNHLSLGLSPAIETSLTLPVGTIFLI